MRRTLITLFTTVAVLFVAYCVLNSVRMWVYKPPGELSGLPDATTIMLVAWMILHQFRHGSQRARAWGLIPDSLLLALHITNGLDFGRPAPPPEPEQEER